MESTYEISRAILAEKLYRFENFVRKEDGREGPISFRDSAGYLGREEDYKSRIAEEVRMALSPGSWKEPSKDRKNIVDCAKKAIAKAGNLVNKNQQIDFRNRLDSDPEAARVLYDIYCGPFGDKELFENAVRVFGAKYDTIAFLFFIKDDTRFLPISPGHFDKAFKELKIDHTTSRQCSWDNYQKFIGIMKDIREEMEEVLDVYGSPRLIDAHTFAWIIQGEKFKSWEPDPELCAEIELRAENHCLDRVIGRGGKRSTTSSRYIRSEEVVKKTRARAKGICQYCNQPAPFSDKNGEPYLEVHHIVWLSNGGEDSIDNTVALCPNCHRKMHILDDPSDVEKLKETVRSLTAGTI